MIHWWQIGAKGQICLPMSAIRLSAECAIRTSCMFTTGNRQEKPVIGAVFPGHPSRSESGLLNSHQLSNISSTSKILCANLEVSLTETGDCCSI